MSIVRAVVPCVAVFAVAIVASCKGADEPSGAGRSGAVRCERDSDCHAGACGPCSSGDVITRVQLDQECAVNPCTASGGPAPTAYCHERVCTIR